jgi:hypothetical protein
LAPLGQQRDDRAGHVRRLPPNELQGDRPLQDDHHRIRSDTRATQAPLRLDQHQCSRGSPTKPRPAAQNPLLAPRRFLQQQLVARSGPARRPRQRRVRGIGPQPVCSSEVCLSRTIASIIRPPRPARSQRRRNASWRRGDITHRPGGEQAAGSVEGKRRRRPKSVLPRTTFKREREVEVRTPIRLAAAKVCQPAGCRSFEVASVPLLFPDWASDHRFPSDGFYRWSSEGEAIRYRSTAMAGR